MDKKSPGQKKLISKSLGWLVGFLLFLSGGLGAEVVSIHPNRGTPKILRPAPQGINGLSDPQKQAFAYLFGKYQIFGLPADLSNLKLVRVQESLLRKPFPLPTDSSIRYRWKMRKLSYPLIIPRKGSLPGSSTTPIRKNRLKPILSDRCTKSCEGPGHCLEPSPGPWRTDCRFPPPN